MSGVRFTNLVAQQRHLTNQILLNGSGVAAGDVNGDGLVDLYFCGLDGPNALFLNQGGWRFLEVADRAGVSCAGLDATGAVLADVDGDRDLDLLVSSLGSGTRLFQNDGRGKFTAAATLNSNRAGTSMALADLDGNGTLDLYVANYRTVTLRDQPNTAFRLRMAGGKPEVASINGQPLTHPELTNRFTFEIRTENGRVKLATDEHGEADAVFLNDGRGRFSAAGFTGGMFRDENGRALATPPFDWGLSVLLRDLNGDGAPDIYVCNDFKSPDRIWINNGRGTFQALSTTAIRQTSLSSMGVDAADIDRDGDVDLFVVDMLSREHRRRLSQKPDVNPDIAPPGDTTTRVQSARNTLLLSRGDGTFAEAAHFAGLEAAEWAWAPVFLDVDLDGFEDVLVSNGFERDGMNVDILREIEARKAARRLSTTEQLGLRRLFPRLDTPNAAFRNLGNLRFNDVSDEWGFNARDISQGMCLADLDGDGDLDVAVNNMNGAAALYRNDSPAPRLAVRLEGDAPNTRGVGARITVRGGPIIQSQEMICGGRYLSSDDFMRVFAAGSPTNRLEIEVRWRSGSRTVVSGAKPNHLYVIRESAAEISPAPVQASPTALFEDISARLNHRHLDGPFDDFASQPSLPHRFSHAGPGVSWFDVDTDGWDDLVLPGGKGGRLEVLLNRQGRFERLLPSGSGALSQDQMAVVGMRTSRGATLLAAFSNFEDRSRNPGAVQAWNISNATSRAVAALPDSPGPLSLADIDADGDLDLFVGGRLAPGRYPVAASSLLLRNQGGDTFVVDSASQKLLSGIGMVSGSVFSDADGDGDPDLFLACEWGPIRMLRNERGNFRDATIEAGLAEYRGWWNGVAVGDFDSDGRLDLAASNLGENTRYQRYLGKPLRLYSHDFEGDGIVEVLEAHYEPSLGGYAPSRNLDALLPAMPWLRARFPSWASFSTATVAQVFSDRLNSASVLEAGWPSSTVFLNRGARFEPVRLPDAAQLAPAFGITVADFDGDGRDDIFLAQNFFGVAADSSRHDAGRGLLLIGDGKGGFRAAPSGSGIAADGEQRGAAAADFDRDGRVDLVVMQNAAETKLFRNIGAPAGLRVRLRGTAANPDAVGAVVRRADGERLGAAKEVHAGSGYLSQNSSVLVVGGTGSDLLVRWPGGRTTEIVIPQAAKEIEIAVDGAVSALK